MGNFDHVFEQHVRDVYRPFLERLAERPASRVIGLPTGHWVMIGRAREFNDTLSRWLRETDMAAGQPPER